jgi:regulator of protease activity HflC (stomatin/prohibitin superfamily)
MTGRYWAPPFSYRYIVKFPTSMQTYTFDKNCFSFINKDKVETKQCMSLQVRLDVPKADSLVQKYRGSIVKGGGEDGYALDEIIDGPVQREIQQTLVYRGSEFTSDQLYADGGRQLLSIINQTVTPKFRNEGIIIEQIMPVGPVQLPGSIVNSIQGALLAKTEATKKDAQLAATIAEGKKTVAQADAEAQAFKAKGEALRAYPELLKLEELKVHKGICPLNASTCVVGSDAQALIH